MLGCWTLATQAIRSIVPSDQPMSLWPPYGPSHQTTGRPFTSRECTVPHPLYDTTSSVAVTLAVRTSYRAELCEFGTTPSLAVCISSVGDEVSCSR